MRIPGAADKVSSPWGRSRPGDSPICMFNSPLSPEKADRIIEVLGLSAGAQVVDIGCGSGEFLLRVMERYKVHGVGIDPDGEALERCRERSAGRVPAEDLRLCQIEVSAFTWPPRLFDAAICIGASHAFGGYFQMLQRLSQRVRSGGLIVVGDLYWRKEPESEYRQILGDGMPAFSTDHAELARAGDSLHLTPPYCARSNQDEWDHFEGCFALNGYRRALSNPDGSEREKAVAKSRGWYDAYLRWGHSAMGFGWFVFLKTDTQ